jgi:hypothetical protein
MDVGEGKEGKRGRFLCVFVRRFVADAAAAITICGCASVSCKGKKLSGGFQFVPELAALHLGRFISHYLTVHKISEKMRGY